MRALHIRNTDDRVRGAVIDTDPTLVRLAPGGRVSRSIASTAPTACGHQAPVSDTFRRAIGIIKVWKTKQQMSEFVRADTDIAILRNGEIAIDLGSVYGECAPIEYPFVG